LWRAATVEQDERRRSLRSEDVCDLVEARIIVESSSAGSAKAHWLMETHPEDVRDRILRIAAEPD
jgi:hypothetical protein